MNNFQEQNKSTCPHCGYPIETNEHSPDCPNNPSNNIEKVEEIEPVVNPAEESIEEKSSEKKEAEVEISEKLKEFLEKEVFSSFEVTEENKKRALEELKEKELREPVRLVNEKSFFNIRESLKLFFDSLCIKGITKKKEYDEKYRERYNEELLSRGIKPGQSHDWRIAREIQEKVMSELSFEEHREDMDELLLKLKEEIKRVKETEQITYNCSSVGLSKILDSGRITPIEELTGEEEKKKARKTGGTLGALFGGDEAGYEERRKATEKEMNLDNEKIKPVYAVLASENGHDERLGGAPNYGEHFFTLKKEGVKDRIIFTEGDSMNPNGLISPLTAKDKMGERHGIAYRQLNWEHARISKALYNVYAKILEEIEGTESNRMQYIEAQILDGIKPEDIEKIKLSEDNPEEADEIRKKFPQYENLLKKESVEVS